MSTAPNDHGLLPQYVPENLAFPDELEDWINRSISGTDQTEDLIGKLLSITIPEKPWRTDAVLATPFRDNFDAQCWFWNRAAHGLYAAGRPEDAAEVWACHYLAILSLQDIYEIRIHKGMPLCNIGFALGRVKGSHALQAKSWTLGIIEDLLTSPATFEEQKNFRNLVAKKTISSESLRQLGQVVSMRYLDHSVMPSLPERCVEYWFNPSLLSPTEDCLNRTHHLLREVRNSFPLLPQSGNRLALLERTWELKDWQRILEG